MASYVPQGHFVSLVDLPLGGNVLNLVQKSISAAALGLMAFALNLHATQTVSMELTAPPPGPSMGGVYTSPYTAIIGAPGQTVPVITGVSTPVICDDFTTDVSINTAPWQATVTTVASLQGESAANTGVKFDGTNATQQQFDYTVAAYLAVEIMDAALHGNTTQQGWLSYALWGLFDPTAKDANGPLSGHWITGNDLTQAEALLSGAESAVTTQGLTPSSYSNVSIYTPTPFSASQEYIVVNMAEPSSWALLAVDLLPLVGLVMFLRRRKLRTQMR